MKNVINNRVGLSFALRCMYLLVNVKGNPFDLRWRQSFFLV